MSSDPSSAPGRRAAERPQSSWTRLADRFESLGGTRERILALLLALAVGGLLLLLAAFDVGPEALGPLGSTLVCAGYAWALAARIDGRPAIACALAAGIGLVVTIFDGEVLRAGAAIGATVLTGIVAIVVTVPSRTYAGAVRETVFAFAVALFGAVAVIGFEPEMSRQRYVYLTLALAVGLMLLIVHRLAAGLQGLGRRGWAVVTGGSVLFLLSLGYFDLIQAYASNGVVSLVNDSVSWSRDHLGAFPRLVVVLVGVPALVWGVHMRARRRQGWWVCAFGVAGTVAVAQMFTNPSKSYVEALLQVLYGLVLGLGVAWLLIRLDLQATGSRGARARELEEAAAVRPESPRFEAL